MRAARPGESHGRAARTWAAFLIGREGLVLGALLLVALALRLPNLDVYTLSLPEGIRLEQLLLLSAGYRPCVDVFCNQGPLALQAMHPTFVLFGESLAAARSSAVIASLAALLATYWLARRLWGWRTAAAVGVLLVLSPTFLKFSRLALPEMVALAPALAAVGAAAVYWQSGSRGWLIVAGLLFGLSLLVKPVAAPAVVPIALLAAARRGPGRRDVAVAALVCVGVVALGVLAVGPAAVWEQVEYRWQSRLAEGRGPGWNWWKIVDELSHDRLGIFALALAGALALARGDRVSRFVLVVIGSWCTASLLLLLFHTPLHDKHILIMLPPVALLAGSGIASLVPAVRRLRQRRRADLVGVAIGLAFVAYLMSLPGIAQRNTVLVAGSEMIEPDPAQRWYDDAAVALERSSRPGSFVVTDFPYLAFRANRLVPPDLVESSLTRIRAGSLTDAVAIEEAARFEPDAVLLWWDRLARLSGFKRWVDQRYQVARVYAADGEAVTTLYVPLTADADRSGEALADAIDTPSGVRFGNGLDLERWTIDDWNAAPGDERSLSVLWRAATPQRRDLVAVLTLRTRDRIVWTSQRLPLLGSGDGHREWAAGRTVAWSGMVRIPRRLEPGSYLLSIRVAPERDPEFLPVQDSPRRSRSVPDDPKGVELATIQVSGPPAR